MGPVDWERTDGGERVISEAEAGLETGLAGLGEVLSLGLGAAVIVISSLPITAESAGPQSEALGPSLTHTQC